MLDSSSKLEGTDSSIVKRMVVQSLVRAMQVLYCARLWSRKYELSLLSHRRHFATRLVSYGHVMDASCLVRYSSPPQVETLKNRHHGRKRSLGMGKLYATQYGQRSRP